jgi:hypothetical protein
MIVFGLEIIPISDNSICAGSPVPSLFFHLVPTSGLFFSFTIAASDAWPTARGEKDAR